MQIQREGKEVTDLIYEAKKIVVIPCRTSGMDGLCAAIGIYRSLKNASKNVYFVYPHALPYDAGDLISKNEITFIKGTRDLIVSIDYGSTPLEKINYAIEGDVCKIVLHPVSKDFDLNRVKFSTSGFDYDLVISVGAQKLEDHQIIFNEYGDEIKKSFIINIDNSPQNENFGTINVIEPEGGNLCQLVLHKLTAWHYKVDKEVAQALLTGITYKRPEQLHITK